MMPQSDHSQTLQPELEPQFQAAVRIIVSEPLDAEAVARIKSRAHALSGHNFTQSTDSGNEAADHAVCCMQQGSETPVHPLRKTVRLPRRLLLSLLATTGGIMLVFGLPLLFPSTPSVYGAVIGELRSAKAFSYVSRVFTAGAAKPLESKVFVSAEGCRRIEFSSNTVSIQDASSQTRLTLLTNTKRALVAAPEEPAAAAPIADPLAWFETLKHHDQPDATLGKKSLDGRQVEGFIVKQDRYEYTVWIDATTRELVQVEHDMFVEGSSITRVVLTDFRFNQTFDAALFSFDVPEGYKKVERAKLPKVAGGEESLVAALRGYTKRSGGAFPKSVTEWGEWAVLFSKGNNDGQLKAEETEIMAHLGSVFGFLISRPKDNYEYVGAGKTLADKRCIVFWYRTDKSKLRAVYNDLSVQDITEKELP